MDQVLSDVLTIIISGIVGAVLGMFIEAFFRFGLWNFFSYWAKRLRLHFKNGVKIEMRRSIELDVSSVLPEDLPTETIHLRDLLFRKCQQTFKGSEKTGDSIIKAASKSEEGIEIEYEFSAIPEDETREQGLVVVMIARATTSYRDIADSYSALWPQLTTMFDIIHEIDRPIRTSNGRTTLGVNLREPMKTLTQTGRIGISGFTSERNSYRISARKTGILFDGVFTAEFGKTMRDMITWFY